MVPLERPRRLVVNADDFGRSSSINEAVIRAHREGILTTASLMVNGSAADEAVELARRNPNLGVGLHLTLVCGRSTLKPTEIPGLINNRYQFSDSPALAGLRYFFHPGLRDQLRHEIGAQFQKFEITGLKLDHVNGHLNIHLHPTVFSILRHHAREWGIRHFRLTRDRFRLNAQIASGQWLYRISHAAIFNLLTRRARAHLRRYGIRHTDAVFGLLQNARVNEAYIQNLLPRLEEGDSELYSHPSLDEFKHEFDALVSPRVKATVEQLGIRLIRYQDIQ
jgi:hopanoid biosynthesis associated protein HpnK